MTRRVPIVVPDGTDLADGFIRHRLEAAVKARLGDQFEMLWPRLRDSDEASVLAVDSVPEGRVQSLTGLAKPPSAADLDVQARTRGMCLVRFDAAARTATIARLDTDTVAIRDRLASVLKVDPWHVEVVCSTVHDDRLDRHRLDRVCITRIPSQGVSDEKRLATWRGLIQTLRDGGPGWTVEEDAVSGDVHLFYGVPRRLPKRVAARDLLPDTLQPGEWANLPLGVDPTGKVAGLDLTLGPQTLVVGPTGSGKSILLRQHILSALAHGHDVAIIDTMKGGADFVRFKAHTAAWGGTIEEARAVLQYAYDEGQRRKELLTRWEAPFWADLPAEVRVRERVVPITVVIDEAMSMLLPMPEPKGLPKDHPEVVQAQTANASKALCLALIGKIARELRFVGVHLAIAMQRPDVGQLNGFGEIRANLTSAIQLIKPGSMPAQETLRMLFPGEQTHAAAEAIGDLDDGTSKGFALVAADGGEVAGFRVAFIEVADIPELIDGLDLQSPPQWELAQLSGTPEPAPFSRISKKPVEEVTHVMDLEWDDLYDDEPAPSGPLTPPVFSTPEVVR